MPKKKDWIVIAAVLIAAVVMLGVSKLMPKTDLTTKVADATLAPDAVEYLDATPAPEAAEEVIAEPEATAEVTAAPTAAPAAQANAALAEEPKEAAAAGPVGPMLPGKAERVRGHVVLTVAGRQYGDPIPMDRDKIITVRQEDGKINKVHITPEKVYMESSTCENQDCVGQGEIHMDTYKTRILSTYIICLPNSVQIEMVPAEE